MRRLLLVAGALLLLAVIPFLAGLVGGLVLWVLVQPLHVRLARRIPAHVSAFFLVLAVFVLLLLPGTWLAWTIVAETRLALQAWTPERAEAWLARTPLAALDLPTDLSGAARAAIGWLSGHVGTLVGGATSAVLNVVIALFTLYYLLVGAAALRRQVEALLPFSAHMRDLLVTRFVEVTEALLLGTVLTAVLQGTIIGLSFAWLGLAPAALWGFVTACVSVLPVLGSAIVWLPGIGVLLAQGRPGAALLLAFLGAGVTSNIDNVVRLFVFRRVSGIHPLVTLVGAFAGVRLVGVIGAFLGPLLLSYFFELLGAWSDASAPARSPAPATQGSAVA